MRWLERLLGKNVRQHAVAAEKWDTCAVGEAHKDFPTIVEYNKNLLTGEPLSPKDSELRRLGGLFYDMVSAGKKRKAIAVYDEIQGRVRVLVSKAKGRSR